MASGPSKIVLRPLQFMFLFLLFVTHFQQQQHHHQALAFVAPSSYSSIVTSSSASASSWSSRTSFLTPISPFSTIHHRHSSSSSSSLHESNNNNNSLILSRENAALISANQQLNEAFSSLNDNDKYETVLTGLCAKIIDGGEKNANRESLMDPIRLLEEMNSSGIIAGPRSVIGLIDATTLTSDARLMASVLSLTIQNGAISRFGSLQGSIHPLPRTTTSSRSSAPSSFSFGKKYSQEQQKRLDILPPVPDDDRAAEVSQAVLFSVLIASCVGINVINGLSGHSLDDFTVWTNLLLVVTITTVAVDNFFDVIVSGGSTVANMNRDKIPENIRNVQVPKKEEMPLGIGTGSLTGSVLRGLSRLLSDNTERDCQCEAAAVFVAYGLGLPVFAFQPNALEGAALVLQSMGEEDQNDSKRGGKRNMDSLASDIGLLKVMIWLMAPVAMELSKYPQLMSSEPREARGFVQRLVNKVKENSNQSTTVGLGLALKDALPVDEEELDAYLRWSLAEADILLRSNAKVVDALSEALAGGAATVGDCVAILEDW